MEPHKKAMYRYCIVPMCRNTTIKTPDKVFFFVPRGSDIRRKWCEAMKRNMISPSTSLYCCEDHFNIEEDTRNYMQYRIMNLQEKQKLTLSLKNGVLPHKFACQRSTEAQPLPRNHQFQKRKLLMIKDDISAPPPKQSINPETTQSSQNKYLSSSHTLLHTEPSNTSTSSSHTLVHTQPSNSSTSSSHTLVHTEPSNSSTSSSHTLVHTEPLYTRTSSSLPLVHTEHTGEINICETGGSSSSSDKAIQVKIKNAEHVDKSIQVNSKMPYRSKGVTVNLCAKTKDIAVSPFAKQSKTISTSPLKMNQRSFLKRRLYQDNPADIASVSSAQPSASSSCFDSDISCSESSWIAEDDSDTETQFNNQICSCMVTAIEKEPKMMIGLPKRSYYLIKLLSENIPLPTLDILITLKKIKLNESFNILALQFGYSQSTISRIFSNTVPLLAQKLKEFIIWPTPAEIFKKLPISFRARYSNVVSIIDCLEIQIEKPSNAVHQSLTWSQYKKCNTLKYLISCTPDGLVNFISVGYGGRATDVTIVEDCGFLNCLPPKTAIMADRGFKDISHLLAKKDCTLVRPPSVVKSVPSTKDDVKLSKRIASLRIHIERVIGRLREFHMLLPHSCVDYNLIPVVDEVMVIACGLINMQDVLIKK